MSLLPAAARTPISPFAWAGRFGMVVGLALGIYIYPYWNFHHIIYTSMALGSVGAGADSGGESSFPCSAAALHGSRWTVFCCRALCGRG